MKNKMYISPEKGQYKDTTLFLTTKGTDKMKKATFRNGLHGKGFAAALVLSIAAVGISTYAAYTSTIPSEPEENTQSEDNIFLYETEDVGIEQTGIPKETPEETTTTSADDSETGLFFSNPKTMPVTGEVINPYSNGELVKSETLDVWKTHDGADIAAEKGSAVASCMKGTVTEIKDDPLWGVCVIIDHGDGVKGHYYGLAETLNVKAGQEVKMGEIIGQIGDTAEIECKTASHLHFGITVNDTWTDPIAFVEE